MNNIISKIREELRGKADEEIKRSGERFFKERIKLYGVKTAVVSKIGKECFKEIKGILGTLFRYLHLMILSGC
jgi:3-methyladenine DNA glycosylase AlkD